MPTEPTAPVRGKHLEALHTVAMYRQGMRLDAHTSAMPVLMTLGYVEQRPARDRRLLWFVTPAGLDLLLAFGEKLGRGD